MFDLKEDNKVNLSRKLTSESIIFNKSLIYDHIILIYMIPIFEKKIFLKIEKKLTNKWY